jgi:hypothetical protein
VRTTVGIAEEITVRAMNANPAYVEGLVPFVHARDVIRSSAFYELFAFEVRTTSTRTTSSTSTGG